MDAYGCRVRSVYLALSGRAVQADRTERLGWRTSSRISSSSIQPASIHIDAAVHWSERRLVDHHALRLPVIRSVLLRRFAGP